MSPPTLDNDLESKTSDAMPKYLTKVPGRNECSVNLKTMPSVPRASLIVAFPWLEVYEVVHSNALVLPFMKTKVPVL